MVINGGSSSGKSGLIRCLQAVLDEPWLAYGADSFVESMPAAMQASDQGIEIGPNGEVVVGPEFRRLEAAWAAGIVAMCRAGANVIIDDIFLGGAASQQRWRDATGEVPTVWVGVRCDPEVAAGRELARGDRAVGMAAMQATIVHEGVSYDIEVDTTHTESLDCARTIAKHLK